VGRYFLVVLGLVLCGKIGASEGTLHMVGQARLEFMFWPVYESRLYSADGTYQEDQLPLRLEIQYLRDVDAEDLVKHTQSEWRRQGLSHGGEQQWLETLWRLLPDVRENDILALVVDERGSSTFLVNGQPLGQIDDPHFGKQFLAIWLSPATSRPELRQALLGL
jgi:Chalcone isomerase-like